MQFQKTTIKCALSIVSLLLLSVLFLIKPQSMVFAQTFSLSISPSLTEILIKPSKSATQNITVTNNGDPTIIIPKIVSVTADSQDGSLQVPVLSEKTHSPSIFSLTSDEYTLDKPTFINTGQTITFPLLVTLAADEVPGDHYFIFMIQTSLPNRDEKVSELSPSVGTTILMTISNSGLLNKNAQIEELSAPIFLDSFDEFPIHLRVKNIGNAFLKPKGALTIKGLLFSTQKNLLPQNILSGTTRIIQSADVLTKKSTNQENTSLLLNRGFYLGPYHVTADLTVEGTSIKLSKSIVIWAFPYKAFILIAIFSIAITILRKRKGKK